MTKVKKWVFTYVWDSVSASGPMFIHVFVYELGSTLGITSKSLEQFFNFRVYLKTKIKLVELVKNLDAYLPLLEILN